MCSVGVAFVANATFSIDSRTLKKGEVFVALPGNKVNGHAFITEALRKGASGLLISQQYKQSIDELDRELKKAVFIGIVPDTYQAILDLARAWRSVCTCTVVGITGSIGKTSTKEILVDIVKCSGMNYIASPGNNNTALSVSLSLLQVRKEHDIAIFEMGVSRRGEMLQMAEIVRPTTGIITAIGHSHMEGLGSLHDIASEKRALFSQFLPHNIGIVNGDTPLLGAISYNHPIIKFGLKTTNQIQVRKIQTHGFNASFLLKLYQEKYTVTLGTNHIGRIMNALAASAAACQLGISGDIIVKALEQSTAVESRFKMSTMYKRAGTLIDDAYNASPESMKAALLAFEKIESKGNKIVVLGDMLELGVKSPFWHRQLGRFLRKVPSLTHVILVGKQVELTKKTVPFGLQVEHVSTWRCALDLLEPLMAQKESTVLVKGSHGTLLHELVKELTTKESTQGA